MSDSSIIREVEEELRRERLEKLWKKYQTLVLGVAFLIIGGVAGYKGWQYWGEQQAMAAGSQYQAAIKLLSDGKGEEAQKALQSMVLGGPAGYRTLARFQLASDAAAKGQTETAVATYDGLAKDASAGADLQGYAQVQAARLRIDAADWTEVQNRLTPLLVATGPWRNSARELMGLAAYKGGKLDEAEKSFNQILADPEAPGGIRQRAEMMLSLIVADTGKPPAAIE